MSHSPSAILGILTSTLEQASRQVHNLFGPPGVSREKLQLTKLEKPNTLSSCKLWSASKRASVILWHSCMVLSQSSHSRMELPLNLL